MNALQARRDALRVANSKPSAAQGLGLEGLSGPSQKGYKYIWEKWMDFKIASEDPNTFPDLETLQTFFWWYGFHSKGKLRNKETGEVCERASVSTLAYKVGRFANMYDRQTGHRIPEDILDKTRDYVRGDMKADLNLLDEYHDKEVLDFTDIEIIMKHILVYDSHEYRCNRLRAQLVCIFLLIAEDGGRIGAIARSEAYKELNTALTYKDVKLSLRASSDPNSPLAFEMQIKFDNRKGERDDPNKFLIQTYFSRPGIVDCVIFWFLTLAFSDDALKDFKNPAELFRRRNTTDRDIEILVRSEMMHVPLFRAQLSPGSKMLSPVRAWGSTCIQTEAKRQVMGAGYRGRFTFYCVRRGVVNALADDPTISTPRRNQMMGHRGNKSTVYVKHYQSRVFTTDVGNIFRGEEQRPEKSKVLTMRGQRDPQAPIKLSQAQRSEILKGNPERQDLRAAKKDLIEELRNLQGELHACSRVSIEAAIIGKERQIFALGQRLLMRGIEKTREAYFESIAGKFPEDLPTRTSLAIARPCLAESLYPELGPPSILTAMEAAVKYILPTGAVFLAEASSRLPSTTPSIQGTEIPHLPRQGTISWMGNLTPLNIGSRLNSAVATSLADPDPSLVAVAQNCSPIASIRTTKMLKSSTQHDADAVGFPASSPGSDAEVTRLARIGAEIEAKRLEKNNYQRGKHAAKHEGSLVALQRERETVFRAKEDARLAEKEAKQRAKEQKQEVKRHRVAEMESKRLAIEEAELAKKERRDKAKEAETKLREDRRQAARQFEAECMARLRNEKEAKLAMEAAGNRAREARRREEENEMEEESRFQEEKSSSKEACRRRKSAALDSDETYFINLAVEKQRAKMLRQEIMNNRRNPQQRWKPTLAKAMQTTQLLFIDVAYLWETTRYSWPQVEKYFPLETRTTVRDCYHKFSPNPLTSAERKSNICPRPAPPYKGALMTSEDIQLLNHLRDNRFLPWPDISAHFPGRSISTLQQAYQLLSMSLAGASQVGPQKRQSSAIIDSGSKRRRLEDGREIGSHII